MSIGELIGDYFDDVIPFVCFVGLLDLGSCGHISPLNRTFFVLSIFSYYFYIAIFIHNIKKTVAILP
jgi:hypothetical protein